MAFDYAAEYDAYWSDPQHRALQGFDDADTLAEQILLSCAGGRVLDLGAGMGRLVQAFLRLGVNAEGVEISPVALAQANAGASGRFHAGSLLALPFADAAFDTLVATNVLECLAQDDLPQALAEMRRVAGRSVFVRIATGAAVAGGVQRIVQPRAWWEQRFFQAGFRKHPSYYLVNAYEALEHDGAYIDILLERVPDAAAAQYPLSALVEERDLHMDMLREAGSRSDAHVARYQWAAGYIRPGDAVLDAACGLGYGSYLLQSGSTARSTLGIDGSDYAYDYAMANFAERQPGLEFRCGMLPQALAGIADHSIDVVISFETLEHIDENVATLAEFHRILTPGGRIITSVPNDWSDASGEDPNPFHVHVYTLERLSSELEKHFVLEELVAQTANQYKLGDDRITWHAAGRSLRQVPLSVRADGAAPPAEWWLAVAMKSPLEGATVPYVETSYPTFDAPAWQVTTYARDYQNPWLVRAMVDIGHRLRNPAALLQLANEVASSAPADAPDVGAALCVLAYDLLRQRSTEQSRILALQARIQGYFNAGPKTPHGVRWQVSLWFVLGRLWLEHGDFARARHALENCVAIDAMAFSPLLCNRTVEAYLTLGSLDLAAGDRAAASAHWRAGILVAHRAASGDWTAALGDIDQPAEFGLPELASLLEYASSCAFALAHAGEVDAKPWWWLHPQRDRLSQSRNSGRQLLHTRLGLQAAQKEIQSFVRQAAVYAAQLHQAEQQVTARDGMIEHQATELAAYREQAQEFARQVSALQGSVASQAELNVQIAELQAIIARQADLPSQIATLQAIIARQADLPAQIATLQAIIARQADLPSQIATLQASVAHQSVIAAQAATLQRRLDEAEHTLLQIMQSNSWRVTRPIRRLAGFLRKRQS